MTVGRPRKPLARHRLIGSFRADRHGVDHINPPPGQLVAPVWVQGPALEHWNAIAPMLENMGLGSPMFNFALMLLVDSLAAFIELEDQPPTIMNARGATVSNPAWRARNQCWDQVVKVLREFGMTPSALNSVRAPAPTTAPGDGDGIAGRINPKLR
jgi:phage terminase small subunit